MQRKTLRLPEFSPSRRAFLGQAGAGLLGTATGLGLTVSTASRAGSTPPVIVYLFLRGGMDGLSLLPPIAGADYTEYVGARAFTRLDVNQGDTLPLQGTDFGLHPFCGDLHGLFNNGLGPVALVQACGHPPGTETRSHFDAQEQIELGTPGEQNVQSGWLARYLANLTPDPGAIFTALVSSSNPPVSLSTWTDVATLDSAGSFSPNAGVFGSTQRAMLRDLYSGSGELDLAATASLDAVDLIEAVAGDLENYVPAGGADYPNTGLGSDLELVAALIKQNLGILAATVDRGGWDNHNNQNVFSGNGFGGRIQDLSESLTAFYQDMAGSGMGSDVVVVVQSEFGRQIKENANRGTDHGLGNPMVVIGGGVTGGLYGSFPGLDIPSRLNDSLRPSTDFRDVLGTVVQNLCGVDAGLVFDDPGYSLAPVGFG